MRSLAVWSSVLVLLAACAGRQAMQEDAVRRDIQASLDRTSQATLAKDIDAYMAELPPDFRIQDASGEVVTRERQRAYVLRDWAVIPRTRQLVQRVESIELRDGTAIVQTSQRWEREMLRPDRSGVDVVLTTQRHRETWKRHAGRWYGYDVQELGGEIFVNGKPYVP